VLHLEHPLEPLRGADYNPREISERELEKLRESIRRFGIVKPIIAKSDGLIVAGHQRTKALRAIGITHAPVYVLPKDTTTADEVRFNQIHNGTDVDHPDANAWIREPLKEGWQEVKSLDANWLCGMAVVRNTISQMIRAFGSWGGCVASLDGEVIHCTQYAMACVKSGYPLLVYGVPVERKEEYREFLGAQYGRFSYRGIERQTFIQTLAQMNRLRNVPGTRVIGSTLYEDIVQPWLKANPGLRGIDFGSGKGDYAAKLRREGHNLYDLELFRRVVGSNVIDKRWINRAITQICATLRKQGRFDYVVCDSVFNSVDSDDAEFAVATMIGALCRPGGQIFYSGRAAQWQAASLRAKRSRRTGTLAFLDDKRFTAIFRNGHWFFQKFHSRDEAEALGKLMGIESVGTQANSSTWRCWGEKKFEVPWENVERAIHFEFELPWPEGEVIGRSEDVLAAMRPFYTQTRVAVGE
jgi:ParB family transcriptional regulator, chromosome partitioning protein